MGRIRTIKPEFFKHEELFDAERASGLPLRLAFAGLWTACDREGRFEWRPRTLKTDILPYDEVDFAAVLGALELHGFVARYTVGGKEYGHIPGFTRHQIVNPRESQSKLPSPTEDDGNPPGGTRAPRVDDASATRQHLARGEGEGEREGDTSEANASADADGVPTAGADIIKLAEHRLPQAEPDDEDDPVKVLFDRGIPFLLRHGVPSEAVARSFIGQCRKLAKEGGQGDFAVLEAFRACRKEGPIEPRAWIMAALLPKADPSADLKATVGQALREMMQ